MSDLVRPITDASFQSEVIASDKVAVVDFWAAWCGPCRALSQVMDELVPSYQDRMKFVKMDTDANMNVPAQFQVRALPTLLVFKNGQAVDKLEGFVPKKRLQEFFDRNL